MAVLQEFKDFIEGDSRVYMYFSQMWDEIPLKRPYDRDPTGTKQIRDYVHMLDVLNHIFTRAPEWTDAAESVGMVGVPMCAVFDYAMGTPRYVQLVCAGRPGPAKFYLHWIISGHAAFLDPDVNKMLKKVLIEWGKLLSVRPSSRFVRLCMRY